MNADEAQKCLLVARRLMQEAESGAGGPAKANAALDRAMKYAEKGKRLDAIAVGPTADAMIARIRATQRTVGADGGPSPSSGSGGGDGGGGGGNAHGQKQAPRRAASASASQQQQRTATKKEEIVKGTPEQEALIAKIRRTADYYEILGVARDAGDDEIKKGYRKMALRLHPDKCKATGAEEVFKSVSKAFACLSDPDKRAAYDRYGTEDPSGSLGRGGGGGMHRRGGHAHHDADEDFDPAEIFNMFFGGGFPGAPGVRFRTNGGGGAARAAQHEREQQARRARRAHDARRGGGDGENAADIFRNLFNLLPLMLVFLMYFLAPGQEEHYALNRSPTFAHGLTTRRLEVPYYVKSMDAFEDAFPEATKQRQRVEHQIELSHLNSLENNCLYERQQQQRMYRFGSKHERQRAREMVLNSCERLQNLRQNKAYGHRVGIR